MIEKEFRADLLAQASISALTSAIYPGHIEQGGSRPCVVYEFHGPVQKVTAGGIHANSLYTVTLQVFGTTHESCRLLTNAVVRYLQGLTKDLTTHSIVSSIVQNVFSDYEETLELYSKTIDLVLHVKEA